MIPQSGRATAREPRARDNATSAGREPFARTIARALDARRELLSRPDLNAVRLLNGAADGLDGLIVDQYADVLVAQLHPGRLKISHAAAMALCREIMEARSGRAVYAKLFPKDRSIAKRSTCSAGPNGLAADPDAQNRDPVPWIGRPVEPEITVDENGVKFFVRPYDGYSTGLFLDHRDNRARVREWAAGRRVLNAFAYTCGFSIAAALGGAASTVSVDVSRKALEWGKRNFCANGVPLTAHDGPSESTAAIPIPCEGVREGRDVGAAPTRARGGRHSGSREISPKPAHTFICSDIFDYFLRAERQRRQFDLIILDPPSFSRAGKSSGGRAARAFSIADDLDSLLAGAAGLLADRGVLLLSSNHRPLSLRAMEASLRRTVAPRRFEILTRPALPLDFRGDPDFAKSIVARVE